MRIFLSASSPGMIHAALKEERRISEGENTRIEAILYWSMAVEEPQVLAIFLPDSYIRMRCHEISK